MVAVPVCSAWINGGGSLPQESPPGPRFTPDDFPLTHLWFLYLLLWFYAAALLLRALWRWIDPRPAAHRGMTANHDWTRMLPRSCATATAMDLQHADSTRYR